MHGDVRDPGVYGVRGNEMIEMTNKLKITAHDTVWTI